MSVTNEARAAIESVESKIKRLRSMMLIHSYIYYKLDDSLISDDQWQNFANELRDLQNIFPEKCNIGWYDKAFENWNGSSGYELPFDDWVVNKAKEIIHIRDKMK